jgi:TPR repeat protein
VRWWHFDVVGLLGRWLEFGDHTRKDSALAAECYSIAATRVDAEAQVNRGFCLEHGIGVARNTSESVELYGKATNQKNPTGSTHYALSVHFGSGCCEDVEGALDHYDFGLAAQPSFLAGNSARCLRGLNKLPASQVRIEREQDPNRRQPIASIDLDDLIPRCQAGPIHPKPLQLSGFAGLPTGLALSKQSPL